jgi:putative DNA primase/helicase
VEDGRMNEERLVPAPSDPIAVARAFVADTYTSAGGVLLLRHHRNAFHRYAGDHWPEDDEHRVSSELWQWLEDAKYWKATKDGPELRSFEPTK